MGNLRSVSKAFEHLGADVRVTSRPEDISQARKLVLPGVGAFEDGMEGLRRFNLTDPLKDYLRSAVRPFLGICLGLQLLFETSEESPGAEGLGIIPGKVKGFRSSGVKIPHMGWNQITAFARHPLFEGVAQNSFFYFVHSFFGVPNDPGAVVATCRYGADDFPAAVGFGAAVATQFHPEKSQDAGLLLLKNFIRWNPASVLTPKP